MDGGGRLTIEATNAVLGDLYSGNHGHVAPGQYVMLAVTDTGVGVSLETLRQACAPAVASVVLLPAVVVPGPLRSPDRPRVARERLPDLAALGPSGYTENAVVHGGRLDPGVELLGKPYARASLARRIRQVLANQRGRAYAQAGPARASAGAGAGTGASADSGALLRIVLVEDEDEIRDSTAALLR